MMLINGQPQTQITVADRGFQYGDGLFETIEIVNGQLMFFKQHLHRLALGCHRLLLPAFNQSQLTEEALQLTNSCSQGILKIIITRGVGGRGYQPPLLLSPTRILSLHPFPNYPDSFQQQGVNVIFCQQRLALNTTLAGIKHLNRLEQVLARAEWQDLTLQEGLMLDTNDYVIEGTMSNIFWMAQNKLYTPSLAQSGIAGIIRDFILKTADQWGIESQQGYFTQDHLFKAEELFVTNSIIGIWAIKSLAQQSFSKGSLTQRFQQALIQYKQQFL
jgi:4-amino-4-deoxychorismate lyase